MLNNPFKFKGDKPSYSPDAVRGDAVVYNKYDAGNLVDVTTTPSVVTPEAPLMQLLIYPTADGYVTINESAKKIYIPASSWTPISIGTIAFSVEAVEGTADVHWQGWYL